MEEQAESTQEVSTSKSIRKRKFSGSDNSTLPLDSSSRQSSSTAKSSSSDFHFVQCNPSFIPSCTSLWTEDTLLQLKININTTDVFTPLELVSAALKQNSTAEKYVPRCKARITRVNPLREIDAESIDSLDTSLVYSLLYGQSSEGAMTKIEAFNVAPPLSADNVDSVENRLYKKYLCHGEQFAQLLIYMTSPDSGDRQTDYLYRNLFQEFAGMHGISCLGDSVLFESSMKMGDKEIISKPDIIFPNFKELNKMKVLALCEVKKHCDDHDDNNLSPSKARTNKRQKIRQIHHLDHKLIGRHGGELLTHFPDSQNQNGLLGLIIEKTNVTFSHLQCTQEQYQEIKTGEPHFVTNPVINFSRQFNYLKASDREELIEPLLKIGFTQCHPNIFS